MGSKYLQASFSFNREINHKVSYLVINRVSGLPQGPDGIIPIRRVEKLRLGIFQGMVEQCFHGAPLVSVVCNFKGGIVELLGFWVQPLNCPFVE